ncbi:hypothetical protein VNO80_01330 [Phaseolus coccineus]|uniref:Uncharacterized protein n=1 Tax=Phaseolus coccineus TaxID=3886 RepID=A0AAN9RSP8_PHACN
MTNNEQSSDFSVSCILCCWGIVGESRLLIVGDRAADLNVEDVSSSLPGPAIKRLVQTNPSMACYCPMVVKAFMRSSSLARFSG